MADVSDLVSWLENVSLDVFVDAQQTLGDEAQAAAPVDTGELRDSLELTVAGGGSQVTGTIGFTADQAGFTSEGTAAHEITGNPLLAFQIGGETVIVHSVQHPGTKATNWFPNAVNEETWAAAVQGALENFST